MKNKRIIHIILVIIIVILLILAVIVIIQTTKEKVMLSKVKQEKEKYTVSETKEKLELEITNLRTEQESKGETLTKEDLPKINNAEIDVRSVVNFPVEVLCNGQKFEIDENFNVNYTEEANETIVTYTTDPEGYTNKDEVDVLIVVSNEKGIKTIEYPNGDRLKCNGRTKVGIDYSGQKNGTYKFKVISKDNKEIEKDVLIYTIDKLQPKEFDITLEEMGIGFVKLAINPKPEDEPDNGESYKSGIDRLVWVLKDGVNLVERKITQENECEFSKNLYPRVKYTLMVDAYDRAGNVRRSTLEFTNIADTRLEYPILTANGMKNCITPEGELYFDENANTINKDGLPLNCYSGSESTYKILNKNNYVYFQIDQSAYGKYVSILCETVNSYGCHGNIFFGKTKTERNVGGGVIATLANNQDLSKTWKNVKIPRGAEWCSLGLDNPGSNPVQLRIYDVK